MDHNCPNITYCNMYIPTCFETITLNLCNLSICIEKPSLWTCKGGLSSGVTEHFMLAPGSKPEMSLGVYKTLY